MNSTTTLYDNSTFTNDILLNHIFLWSTMQIITDIFTYSWK